MQEKEKNQMKIITTELWILFSTGSSALAMYVLMFEYVGKRHRHVIGTTLFYFWILSLMVLALFAWLIRDWRTLAMAAAIPGLLTIFFWW